MCGIVGYVGARNAADVLLRGLSNLEYRGYDSAGISVLTNSGIDTLKAQGRLQNLVDKYGQSNASPASCGIGHTRWATHGEPSDVNSHPHFTEKLSLVHNGIIENYMQLKSLLIERGYAFTSQTDTETIAKLIDYHYDGDAFGAIQTAIGQVEGSYALCVLFADRPNEIYAVRAGSPLIVGLGDREHFYASDVPAILEYTRDYYLLEEGEIARICPEEVVVRSAAGDVVSKERHTANWDITQAQKSGYPHFMLKEIHEQPAALQDTIHHRVKDGLPYFVSDNLPEDFFSRFQKVFFIACGTAMHAGTVGKALLEKLARIPGEVDYASEFRYRDPILPPDSLVLIISQSGETADTLAALRLAKRQGATTMAIVNVMGSSIAREADYVLHTHAGPEIAVASTKAFSVQIALLYLLAVAFAHANGKLKDVEAAKLTEALLAAIDQTASALAHSSFLQELSDHFTDTTSLFYMGRGIDYSLAMEGSLKLKEVSYIHSESYAAGELKHGTISLITPGVPVVGLITQSSLLPKTISNIKEVRSRGGYVLLIAREGFEIDSDVYDDIIWLPAVEELAMPILAVIALQLFAYHVAVARGCDVDKPRNLAKSVTVE